MQAEIRPPRPSRLKEMTGGKDERDNQRLDTDRQKLAGRDYFQPTNLYPIP